MTSVEADEDLTPDDIFEILSNSRRRHLIHTLHQRGGEAALSELADRIAAAEHDIPLSEISTDQRRRVYISLYQTHLPKLEEYGIVDYDEDDKTVRLADRVDRVDHYLYIDERSSRRWWVYYASLSAAGLIVVAGTWVDLYPVSLVSTALIAQVVAVAFVVLAAVHYLATRRTGPRELREPHR